MPSQFSPLQPGQQPTRQHVLELQRAIGQWQDWTPTVTQSGAVTFTVTEAKYCLIGPTCHLRANLAITGAGTGGNDIVIGGTPAAATPAEGTGNYGVGTLQDASDSYKMHAGVARWWAGNGWLIVVSGNTAAAGTAPNVGLANGDTIELSATYRVA